MGDQIGDGPVQAEYEAQMHAIADALHLVFNGPVPLSEGKTGFVLLVFPFGDSGRCNYMSNASREDIVTMLREQINRFEGMPSATGRG